MKAVHGVQPTAAAGMSVSFTVWGPPVGKQRPRVTKNGTYTPRESRRYEGAVKLQARLALHAFNPSWGAEGKWPKDARYSLSVIVCWGDNRRRDIDNVLKSAADGCNKILYNDDAQVRRMEVMRVFEGEPRTEVTVEVLP